jgi:hypothetical protein
MRCSVVSGVPWRRATKGCSCSNMPARIARYHAERESPDASSVMIP